MKIRAWKGQSETGEVFLKLVEEDGGVCVIACDSIGRPLPGQSSLCKFITNGELCLLSHINPNMGFRINDKDGGIFRF